MSACRVFIALCVSLAALSSYGCEDGTTTRLGPSRVSPDGRFVSSSVSVESTDISALSIPGAVCPVNSPFLAPVNLVVRADQASDMRLQQVQMQFVDVRGVSESFRNISGLELSTLFGSTLVPAFATRTFPFALPFGCIGAPAGIVNIVVVTDSPGHDGTVSLRVKVR